MQETAYAKINLALHVRRRRADGYHEIETLFAFLDDGDRLSATPAARDGLQTIGPFAAEIDDLFGNIAAKALSSLPHGSGWSVTLEKRLPVAAGLGGGSADAGAVFRMVERSHGLPEDWRVRAARLGADVPACIASETCIGFGTGTELRDVQNDLSGTPVLLVNPRIAVPTPPVFNAWNGVDQGALPTGSAKKIALAGRNDLEVPAVSLCPEIAEVLQALCEDDPMVARMSGSGATCFALFEDHDGLLGTMERLRFSRPRWWMMGGLLR